MKKIISALLLIFPLSLHAQDLPKSEFGISAGYLFEGEVYLWEPNVYGSAGETFLLKADYVGYFSDYVGLGGYVSYGNPWYDGLETVTMSELGVEFITRFKTGDQFLFKPSVCLGYRSFGSGGGKGFAVNLAAALQYSGEKVKPYLELGFISQPAGGNSSTDITFSPIFQTSVGITF